MTDDLDALTKAQREAVPCNHCYKRVYPTAATTVAHCWNCGAQVHDEPFRAHMEKNDG